MSSDHGGTLITVEIINSRQADREAVFNLYLEGGWWAEDERVHIQDIDRVIDGSFCFAVARNNGNIIGMGRAISDGISDAYIQDVIVSESFRKSGIGREIIKAITHYLRQSGVSWIGLIANPGTSKFYSNLGFSDMHGFTPMILTEK